MAPQETPLRVNPIVLEKRVASKTVTSSSNDTTKELSTNHLASMKGADRASMTKKEGSTVGLRDWGYPGYLTSSEFLIFVSITFSIWNASVYQNLCCVDEHKSIILKCTHKSTSLVQYQLVCMYV